MHLPQSGGLVLAGDLPPIHRSIFAFSQLILSMHSCSNCGSEYKKGANFCSYCGIRLEKSTSEEPTSTPRKGKQTLKSETCVIALTAERKKPGFIGFFSGTNYFLEAIAIGPNGRYTAGKVKLDPIDYSYESSMEAGVPVTEVVLNYDTAETKLNSLIMKLYDDGWQSIGGGGTGYRQKFQRYI